MDTTELQDIAKTYINAMANLPRLEDRVVELTPGPDALEAITSATRELNANGDRVFVTSPTKGGPVTVHFLAEDTPDTGWANARLTYHDRPQTKTPVVTYTPLVVCLEPRCGTSMHDLEENRRFHTDERHGGTDPGYRLASKEEHAAAGWGVENYPASITL